MSSPWVYAARRLLLAVPLLFGMSVLIFALMRLVPGDPAVAAPCARPSTSTSRSPRSTSAGWPARCAAISASTSARTSPSAA